MKKTKKIITGFVTLMSAVTLLSCIVPYLSNSISKKDQYTVISDDGYSETTYYRTREAYNKYLKSLNATSSNAKSTAKYIDNLQEDERFVIAASKQVQVEEVVDNQGNILASSPYGLTDPNKTVIFDTGGGDGDGSGSGNDNRSGDNGNNGSGSNHIGTQYESWYYLSISMVVYYNTQTKKYEVETNSSWDDPRVWAWETEKAAEEFHSDFIGISWGGNRNIQGEVISASGIYYDNNPVQISKQIADDYTGYIWQFKEKSGWMGKELKRATMKVNLEKPVLPFDKETNVKMTYIHTYSEVNGGVAFSGSTDGDAAASLTLSSTEKQWQIQINISDIYY